MTRCLRIAVLALVACFAGAPALFAQPPQWHFKADRFGSKPQQEDRSAYIERQSTVLGAHCTTRLQFNATQDQGPGITGVIGLEFGVSPMDSIKGFDFEYFDGPFAPAGGRKLMRITITRGGKSVVHMLIAGGWLDANNTFIFATNNETHDKQGEVRKLLEQLQQGGDSIEIAMIDGHDQAIVLSATFPLAGIQPAIEALLKGL